MGSAENGGGQHPAPEGRKIGTPPPSDVFDTFPNPKNICFKVLKTLLLKVCTSSPDQNELKTFEKKTYIPVYSKLRRPLAAELLKSAKMIWSPPELPIALARKGLRPASMQIWQLT